MLTYTYELHLLNPCLFVILHISTDAIKDKGLKGILKMYGSYNLNRRSLLRILNIQQQRQKPTSGYANNGRHWKELYDKTSKRSLSDPLDTADGKNSGNIQCDLLFINIPRLDRRDIPEVPDKNCHCRKRLPRHSQSKKRTKNIMHHERNKDQKMFGQEVERYLFMIYKILLREKKTWLLASEE
ncbi:hypothetical protein OUZ56_027527 [Daphnia magna]|uniref:Uncharacterized protein n=1 Tax=Daphnia magna TaxID=35525 RepID=A0ABQ9ZQP2_9CRUS|nr:hypothetical protein OUZ56_027527 [Daphnia magna]